MGERKKEDETRTVEMVEARLRKKSAKEKSYQRQARQRALEEAQRKHQEQERRRAEQLRARKVAKDAPEAPDVPDAVQRAEDHTSSEKTIPSSKLVKNWTTDQVGDWLRSLNDAYGVYADIFQKDDIDGADLFDLDDDDLEDLVTKGLHRRRIKKAIKALLLRPSEL